MRGVPTAPRSQRVLAAALFELVHRRTPRPEDLGALTGLRVDAVEKALTELMRVGAMVVESFRLIIEIYSRHYPPAQKFLRDTKGAVHGSV